MILKETGAKIEELVGHAKEYIQNRIDITKLEIAESISILISTLFSALFFISILFISIIFFGISIAFIFSNLTGEYYWGFMITGGLYFLVGLFFWKARKKIIQTPIMNLLIKKLFNK